MAPLFFFGVGAVGLFVSALLGVVAWVTALRPPESVGGVFGRGVVGVLAVLSFGIGAMGVAAGLELFSIKPEDGSMPFIGGAVLVFLAFEFVIGATLYARADGRNPSSLARVLSKLSYGIAGLLLAAAVLLAIVVGFGGEGVKSSHSGSRAGRVRLANDRVRIEGGTWQHFLGDSDPDIAAFDLGRTEVTVSEYRACVTEGACTPAKAGDETHNWGRADREDHPVNAVSWDQADAYCRWVDGRLPTEVEWEWAARGRDEDRKYPWGDAEPTCELAVVHKGCGTNTTAPVGSRSPQGDSRDGVQDLLGNAREWTSSWHSYKEEIKVLRGGGAWSGGARVSFRNGNRPPANSYVDGFRCAWDVK